MVEQLNPWVVVEFTWGTAVRHQKGRWEKLFLRPSGQEIDVSELDVELYDDGIIFNHE